MNTTKRKNSGSLSNSQSALSSSRCQYKSKDPVTLTFLIESHPKSGWRGSNQTKRYRTAADRFLTQSSVISPNTLETFLNPSSQLKQMQEMAKLLGYPSFLTHFDAATKMRRNQLLPVPTIHIPKGLPTAEEIHLVEKVQKFMKGNAFKIPLFPEKREHLYQLAVVVERNFGVGTLWGDVMILNNPEASQEERLAAAKRLARWRFSWADKHYLRGRILKDGGARRTLLDLGSAKAKDVNALLIEDLLPNAVFSAAADSETPQYYRVGRNWIKGKDGRKIKVIPDKFPPPLYAEWLLNKALEHCMRLLNPNWKRTGEPVVNFSDLDSPEKANLSKLRPDPEEELSAHELREKIYAAATPGIRKVLDLLIFGYSREEAAKILGLRRSTIDVQLHRLKKKLLHRL